MNEGIKENTSFARRRFELVNKLIDDGDYEFVVANLYYVCFYYLRALLLTKGTEYQTHKGVLIGFDKYSVKEGVADKEVGRFLRNLAQKRIEADYDFMEYPIEGINELVAEAERFAEFSEKYLADYSSNG